MRSSEPAKVSVTKPVFPAHIYITVVCTLSSLTPNKRVTPNCLCCTCTYGTYSCVTGETFARWLIHIELLIRKQWPSLLFIFSIRWQCRYPEGWVVIFYHDHILLQVLSWKGPFGAFTGSSWWRVQATQKKFFKPRTSRSSSNCSGRTGTLLITFSKFKNVYLAY